MTSAGILVLIISGLCACVIGMHGGFLGRVIALAFFTRLILLAAHFNIGPLPDSGSDALVFQEIAMEKHLTQDNKFKLIDTYFISTLYSWIYDVLGIDVVLLHLVNIIAGCVNVYLASKVAASFLELRYQRVVAWFMALYPPIVLYSVVTLREVYAVMFLLVTAIFLVRFVRTGSLSSFFLAVLALFFASAFHGALSLGAIVFSVALYFAYNVSFSRYLLTARISIRFFFLVSVGVVTIALVPMDSIPKLSILFNLEMIDQLFEVLNRSASVNTEPDGADYPGWLAIDSLQSFVMLVPVRFAYFVFGPFFWDVRNLSMMIGSLDGLTYILMFLSIFRSRELLYRNRDKGLIILILFVSLYLFVFALAVTNFGTGFRHRTKFVIFLLIIALYFQQRRSRSRQELSRLNQ